MKRKCGQVTWPHSWIIIHTKYNMAHSQSEYYCVSRHSRLIPSQVCSTSSPPTCHMIIKSPNTWLLSTSTSSCLHITHILLHDFFFDLRHMSILLLRGSIWCVVRESVRWYVNVNRSRNIQVTQNTKIFLLVSGKQKQNDLTCVS